MVSCSIEQTKQRQRGFSMVEVAVTLAVLGILLASAMPSMGAWMVNARIRNTAESIQEGLQKARAEAVRRNQSVTFWMVTTTDPKVLSDDCTTSATGGSWVVSLTDPTNKCAVAPSNTTAPQTVAARPVGEGGDGVTVSAKQRDATTDATSITFNAFGQVANAGPIGRILVNDGTDGADHRRYRVMISSGGRTLVCDEAVTSTTDPRLCPAS
ncbi:GspH/FimT family pseudopilin [Aquabacterium sp.]|uniref:GspH/FimT family pseudopilin n=1 Tax=Aquabacterium sp. TaxID=1872578 RepID=UPI0019BF4F09|nr:GspH/FimT family pseudopilin [Aquabacterium sp.]MBC7699085.1 GspH/FimT family pseudopilin [Aquabacterium sp.]